ncbi:MAG: Ig-like domain-containing protein [Gammaproteobacteria bacterium]
MRKTRPGTRWRYPRNVLAGLMLMLMLTAAAGCGGSGDSSADPPSDPPVANRLTNNPPIVPIIGTVADGSGPVTYGVNSSSGTTTGGSRSVNHNGTTISILQGSETSPPPGYIRIEQNNAAVSYTGTWSVQTSTLLADYSGGSADMSAAPGATATLTFSGTAVRWIGYSDTLSGIANVSLDGGNQTVVNTYSTVPQSQLVLYSASGLSPTTHTLTITVTGTHSLLSLGANITVDAFDVQPPPPTTTPPNVAITAPVSGATVSGVITVSATVTANTSIASVQFQLDGNALGAPLTAPPYQISWDTTAVSNGSHTLTAIATDTAGHSATSAPVVVTVSNNPPPGSSPPTVSITAPANGSTISGLITVSADASENGGQITQVQFQLDGNFLGAPVTQSPYQISWDTTSASNGTHALTAVATDSAGNTATSSAVSVTVSNGPPPPVVSVTSPANGATVSASVTVSANATDNGGQITQVQFQLDGSALGAPVTQSPYQLSWDTTTATNGSHALTAVATNNAGESTTSAPVTVTVSNASAPPPPTVAITSPAKGATVSGSVTVSATASDSSGTITQVQFQLDGSKLGNPVTQPPYQTQWDATAAASGDHTLTAIATNNAGESTTSAPVTVTVANGAGGGGTTQIEWNSSAVKYTGTWYIASDPKTTSGTATETNQANATATLTFNGTRVTWISYTGPGAAGIANVSVDGKVVGQVDTYSPTVQYQAPVYTASNLAPGTHTFTITVTGQYDPSGNSAYVVVDRFDVNAAKM